MPSFQGVKKPNITVTVKDRDEVQICPRCTFPNSGSARVCVDCDYPLQEGNGRWVPARLIRKCGNSACDAFICTKDSKCQKCGKSTSEEAATDPSPSEESPSSAPVGGSDTTFVLICPDCGTQNTPIAETCSQCHRSLEDTDPVAKGSKEQLLVRLENLRTKKVVSLELKSGQCVMIGRRGILSDQLTETDFVSAKHLSLSNRDGCLWIRDESRNGTYLNGSRRSLELGAESPLHSNTVVGLGDPSQSQSRAAFFKITY